MKIRLLMSCVLLTCMLGDTASAHVVENGKQVSAIMHIQPDDDPIAGKDTRLQFTFASSANAFAVRNCDCSIILVQGEQEVAHVSLIGTNTVGVAQVTFPQIGAYEVVLHGNPRDTSFQPFTLTYTARVDRSLAQPASNRGDGLEAILFSSFALIVLWCVAYTRIRSGKRYSPR